MKFRIAFRAGKWCVQRHITTVLGPADWKWSPVPFGAHRFRLLAKIHLVVLREWSRR